MTTFFVQNLSFYVTQNFECLYLFFYWTDSGDIYGGDRQNSILYDPQQKKGKKGTKKGIIERVVKSSKIFENEKKILNPDISHPFYPFYPFS